MADQVILGKPGTGKVLVKWLGHSTFKIKAVNTVIYIDPYEIEGPHEQADMILITHGHYDHCDKKSVEALKKPNTAIIAAESAASKIKGAKGVHEGERLDVLGVKIHVVAAYNVNKPYHPKNVGVGFVLTVGGHKIYHAGDTDLIPEMKDLAAEALDVAMLPIGGTYTMDEAEASEAVAMIKPKLAIPMHYGKLDKVDPWKFKSMVGKDAEVMVFER